jgi:hypothetical protein
VEFSVTQGPKGLQAAVVKVIRKKIENSLKTLTLCRGFLFLKNRIFLDFLMS